MARTISANPAILTERINAKDRPVVRKICTDGSVDELSCRLFICVRCACQVLICRRCDRNQIYCMGNCAQEARRDKQREARRRYQASPVGRAMHTERSRRYRARVACVTDHSPVIQRETCSSPGSAAPESLSVRGVASSSSTPSGYSRCHRCGLPASAFLRLSGLRRGRGIGKKRPRRLGGSRFNRPP